MKKYIKLEIEITEFINETEITVLVSTNYDASVIDINNEDNIYSDTMK